jgi:chromosome segregation ATPase
VTLTSLVNGKSSSCCFPFQTASKSNEFQTEADRKMRHYRLLRQQVHELELSQRTMKRNFYEMQNHKLADRVRGLEVEQKRLANANFNLSRQVSDFDKLHTSLLELLEDVEEIETKLDKTVPEIRSEISKVEIDSAQLSSDQNILKEEDHNMAKTIQALAVSISTLQSERSTHHNLEREVNNLKMEMEVLKTAAPALAHNKVS